MEYAKETPANRWRIHNWRCVGNQRVDGIDLKMKTCSEKFSGLTCINDCSSKILCNKQAIQKDFTWGDKNGLKFKRVKGPSNDILGKGACGSWGYSGGQQNDVSHASNRIGSRKAVFLQA